MWGHVGLCAEILPLTCVGGRIWGFNRPALSKKEVAIVGPIELIIATFENDEDKAGEVLKAIEQATAEKALVHRETIKGSLMERFAQGFKWPVRGLEADACLASGHK